MKKFFKFVLGTLSLATLACGGYYFFKKYIKQETPDDFEDFDDLDDLDNFEDDASEYDYSESTATSSDNREYVSINLSSDSSTAGTSNSEESDSKDAKEDDSKEDTVKEEESKVESNQETK